MFTDCDRRTHALRKKVRGDRRLLHILVFIFQVENGLHGKSENIEYLWLCSTSFFILSPSVLKYNRQLNENYWCELDLKDHRVTFYNFAYISAILVPILTNLNQNDGITARNKVFYQLTLKM